MISEKKVYVSIIIPVKEINEYLREFVPKFLSQSFQKFEIIILPNEKSGDKFPKTRIIPSGAVGPAQKRDIGAKSAHGEILAFIDDDAYPADDSWLERALKTLKKDNIAAVGGPQLTPPESNFFQKLSGKLFESALISGPVSFRHKSLNPRECDDLPSCNLFIKKNIFLSLGGFETSFWPGEDTKLCLDIQKAGYKLLYNPSLRVYHHRRKTIPGYFKQIWSYSTHRGFFAKKYPQTSFKVSYFIPTLFVLGLLNGFFLSFYSSFIKWAYFGALFIYFFALLTGGFKTRKISFVLPFLLIGFATHIIYGVGFLIGFLRKSLKSKYRK